MKPIRTFVNEEQYKKFRNYASMHGGMSDYELNKKIVVAFLNREEIRRIEEEKQRVKGINIAYWLIGYGLIVATILLIVF